jgi:hypothetical protein
VLDQNDFDCPGVLRAVHGADLDVPCEPAVIQHLRRPSNDSLGGPGVTGGNRPTLDDCLPIFIEQPQGAGGANQTCGAERYYNRLIIRLDHAEHNLVVGHRGLAADQRVTLGIERD